MRKVAIWANISVLRELVAELTAAARCRRERSFETLGQFFYLEHLQCRFGRASFGSHILAQLGRTFGRRESQLRRAEHAVLGELERLLARNAGAFCVGGKLLDEPEHVRRT